LLEAVGAAAKQADTALVMVIDELHYAEEAQLAALITTLNRAAAASGGPRRDVRERRQPTAARRLAAIHDG
jgi:hypothetical protein